MLGWFAKRRRHKILSVPFPASWETILDRNVWMYRLLSEGEQARLRDAVMIFVAEKNWEGCGGLEMTDEIRVTIAAMACLLILNMPHNYYDNVETILVYPSEVVLPERPLGFFEVPEGPMEPVGPISGEAFEQGPLIIVWDAVLESIQYAGSGYNVVYHEFAHKLDMQAGGADGLPRLGDAAGVRNWETIMSREYAKLENAVRKGKATFLDEYGATDEVEFFAVATEHFFDQPREMAKQVPDLYRILKAYYRQDPVGYKK